MTSQTPQTYKPQNVIEIDLMSLFKKILIQWRAIIVFALIIGMIAAGLKYAKDSAGYKSALALSQADMSSDEIIENSGLTDDDQDAVQQAVAQKKQIESESDYLTNSLYMNLNPMNLKQMSILYFIKADKGADAADLLSVYDEMLTSDESVKKIQKASGLDTEPKYIRELVDVYDAKSSDRGSMTKDSSTDVMKVQFYLPDGADSDSIEETIEQLIKDYDISDLVAGGTVRKVSAEINTVADRDIQTEQTNYTYNLNNLKSSYKTATDAFSDGQKTFFEQLLRENGLDDQTDSTGQNAGVKKETASAGSGASSTEEQAVVLPAAPSFSGKYFAIGFILGILVYCFCMVIFEILRSRCSSIVSGNGRLPLGAILDITQQKRNFLFCDRILQKLLYSKQSDIGSVIDRILTKAQMNSSHDRITSAEIWTVGFDGTSLPSITQLIRDASSIGIAITMKPTSDSKPDAMLEDLAPDKSVILAVQDGQSRKKDASFLTEMLFTRHADYLGQIELM